MRRLPLHLCKVNLTHRKRTLLDPGFIKDAIGHFTSSKLRSKQVAIGKVELTPTNKSHIMQEALNLQVTDIDAKRMLVQVRRGKGHKDRLIPLPPKPLALMRQYWASHRKPVWIFPYDGRDRKQAPTSDRPMCETTPQKVIKKFCQRSNPGKPG